MEATKARIFANCCLSVVLLGVAIDWWYHGTLFAHAYWAVPALIALTVFAVIYEKHHGRASMTH